MSNLPETSGKLEGVPAILYAGLWNVREAGFLKEIMAELGIKQISLRIDMEDYKPGGILVVDGEKGDYKVISFTNRDEVKNIPVDIEVVGNLKPIVLLLQEGKNIVFGVLGLLLKNQLKVRGIRKALLLAKLFARCGMSV